MNPLALEDRTIWILGASSGIGLELTKQLLLKNNFVIASARNLESLKQLQIQYPRLLKLLKIDLAFDEDIDSVGRQLSDVTDFLDTVIYSAGVCEYTDPVKPELNDYHQSLRVNFLSVVKVFKEAIPFLKRCHRTPQFAVISSLTTELGFPRAGAYGSSKAALNYFMNSLRVDLVNTPLKLTLVQPGFVATPMTAKNDFAMPFMISAEKSAAIIIRKIEHGTFNVRFPDRLVICLQLMKLISRINFRWLATKMTRIHNW